MNSFSFDDYRVVAFTPIKMDNTRCPNKNVRLLAGRPLLNHAIDEVDKLNCPNYLYSYDDAIMDYVDSEKIVFVNESLVCTRATFGIQVYREFVSLVDADIYILYHVTSPFLCSDDIMYGLEKVAIEGFDCAFSATKELKFANYDGMPLNYAAAMALPRTQELTPVILMNSSFFIFKKEALDYGSRLGRCSVPIVVNCLDIDIDYPEDFELCEAIIRAREEKS